MEKIVFLEHKKYVKYVVDAINGATVSVDVAMYKCALPGNYQKSAYTPIAEAIETAIKKGVGCRFLLCRMEPDTGVSATNWATTQWLKRIGAEVRRLVSRACLHTKFIIVDSNEIIVGSHNWSGNTYDSTVDVSVAIKGYGVADQAAGFFNSLWSKSKEC
uniref:Putative phosphatidylcholine-hydrolyzing phospholipase D n=1 Tax=viral metagenome TaxID=1070528 RepID=A0A6H1ZYS6_9ZZZZ